MRLINTETLELNEFFEPQVPAYAILSHTWEKDELTLREWTEPSAATTSKAGYKKVCMAASLSRRSGFAWLWVDTVCIDKTSSAELSEAINSMFNCNEARICYAFLADVSKGSLEEAAEERPDLSEFRNSRWFTRGWTLQELIAPANLVFYSREWAHLGTKASFASVICSITGIDKEYLWPTEITPGVFASNALGASVATRMSWLAKRQTTRVEDMSYCMLGIFDINMPLLYGEGRKAFQRLQEEIIRVNDDQSIFVWNSAACTAGRASDDFVPMDGTIGFLAPTPRAFECAKPAMPLRIPAFPSPYTITNAGLSITLPLIPTLNGHIGMLSAGGRKSHSIVGVFMCTDRTGQMSRIVYPGWPLKICLHPSKFDRRCVYVRVVDPGPRGPPRRPMYIPSSRNDVGLVVSLRQNMERHVPDFYSFPADCIRQAPESVAALVFPPADRVPEFVAVDEASHVRAVTTGVIFGATAPKSVTKSSFCLLLTQTTISYLKTSFTDSREYRYTAVELGKFPRYSRSQWLAFARSQETKILVSKMVRERNAIVISKYIQAQWPSYCPAVGQLGSGDLEKDCYKHVEFGCCDMGHPGFAQLRLMHIGWPPEPAANPPARSLFSRKK